MAGTAGAGKRIETLDILRGVAVMGILAMNAAAFSMPEQAYFNPAAYGGTSGIDLGAWIFNFIFFDGKMRGLFSLLFGASMLLIVEQAQARGKNAALAHYWRIFWLGIFGAVHFYLIWPGDILLHYALIALVAFFFCRLGMSSLILWAAFMVLVDLFVMIGGAFAYIEMSRAAASPTADAAAVQLWMEMKSGFAPLAPGALEADIARHRGPYLELLAFRWEKQALYPFAFLKFGGPETLALMLMGMIGLRSGFLTGAWEPRVYRRIGLSCALAGAAGFAVLAIAIIRSGFDVATLFAATLGWSVIFRLLMVVGYAALIILMTRKGGALVERIAAAGRAAFTNYLGTSLIVTFLFYGWGLGLYGSFSRAEMWIVVLAMWLLILAWSKPWLERYRYGPLEWLWRSLSHGRPQPMRRAVEA